MSYTFHLPEFEGPLDLLLRLIERAELDITSIALAQVADEYLAHVRGLADPDPRALAEFLVIAARLLLIKSRALLPRTAVAGVVAAGGDADAEELAQQLKLYQQYKRAAEQLRASFDEERRLFVRQAPPPVIEIEQEL
ncbi:MAG: segregation/condensation protein A, partial [Chloroflexales bacterium]|nr:segregation/condensation protein A [Chloroflexales bacterium]